MGTQMQFKAIPSFTKQIDGRKVTGLASIFGNVDSVGDRIKKGAFKKTIKEGIGRAKHLWQHDFYSPPIAKILALREVGVSGLPEETRRLFPEATGGLEVEREYLATPRGDEVLTAIQAGAVDEMSFGYDVVQSELVQDDESGKFVNELLELRLWDTSDVLWGANAATSASKSGAILFEETKTVDQSTEWSQPVLSDFTDKPWETLSVAEKKRIAEHYAWANSYPPEQFEDLKLAHHQPRKHGVGPVVWKGAARCMVELHSAEIPQQDLKSVFEHLEQHYQQYSQSAPKFANLALAQNLVTADLKDLDEEVLNLVKQLQQTLKAEPLKALTPFAEIARIEIAKRKMQTGVEL